ncbi:MAG: cupin domain-containing protein [Verrucomicrobia bacterium]|nr:cupin domain-containing protein [Verrucomicrobiota bacterium]
MIAARPLLFALLTAVSAAPLPLMAQAPAPAAPSAKLGSRVFVWDELTVKPNATGTRRDVVDLPTATFEKFESHVTTLNVGQASHLPHRHAREEFIIVKEGTVEVHINGQTQPAGPGSLLFYASNDAHAVRNIGTGPATYLVFNYETVATRSAPAEGAAVARRPGTLASTVFNWDRLAVKPTKAGARRDVVNSPTVTCANFECHVTTLNPGEVPHAAHRHPDEEIVIVKEGVMEVTINGVTRRGGPGSIFFYGSNDEHGMKNVGGTVASYHVVRIVTAATPKAAPKT